MFSERPGSKVSSGTELQSMRTLLLTCFSPALPSLASPSHHLQRGQEKLGLKKDETVDVEDRKTLLTLLNNEG